MYNAFDSTLLPTPITCREVIAIRSALDLSAALPEISLTNNAFAASPGKGGTLRVLE